MTRALTTCGLEPLAERVENMKRDEAIRETTRNLEGHHRWLPMPLQPIIDR